MMGCVLGVLFPLGLLLSVRPLGWNSLWFPVCTALHPNPQQLLQTSGAWRMEAAGSPGPENMQLVCIPLGCSLPREQRQVAVEGWEALPSWDVGWADVGPRITCVAEN